MPVEPKCAHRDSSPDRARTTPRSLWRLWPYLRPHRARVLSATALAVVASCMALLIPLVLKWIVDGPVARHDPVGVWLGGAWLLLLGVGEAGIFGVRRWLAARPLACVEATLRRDLYRQIQRLPIPYHDRTASGQLLSRATTDLQVIRLFLAGPLTFLLVHGLTIVVGSAILFSLQWLLTLIVLLPVVPVAVLCTRFEALFSAASRDAQDQSGDLATASEESVLGIRVIKGLRQQASRVEVFRLLTERVRATELRKGRLLAVLSALLTTLPELATGLALVLGVLRVANGSMSTGTLLAFVAMVLTLRPSVTAIGTLLAQSFEAATASGRVFEVLDEPAVPAGSAARPMLIDRPGAAELAFESVTFAYPDSPPDAPPALSEVSFRIPPGETLAIVGATASGKTTLAALVSRLYEPTGGRITLDGVDIATVALAELRRRVAVAFDEPTLFSSTVAENVLMGLDAAGPEDVDRALTVAHAHEFVDHLPDGLRTEVGEGGLTLSGGQRQRIALARTVIASPRLMVLDDPLSALDIHTEAMVEAALHTVLETTTAVVITHRPSTVQLANRVALLSGGRLVAAGQHEDLLRTSPEYASLMTAVESSATGGPIPAGPPGDDT